MEALLPAVTPETRDRFCFVSDDLHPQDILRRGHLDFMIRRAVETGLDPVTAVRLASINPARYFGLRGRGAVAPGYLADLAVLSDLETFSVERVYKAGRVAAEGGRARPFPGKATRGAATGHLRTGPLSAERFSIPDAGGPARVIRIVPGQIHTEQVLERPQVRDGRVVPDTERDILTLAVVERHHGSGNLGLGLVRGFGLREGALAGSVAHDAHNVIAVGTTEEAIRLAVETLRDLGGGLVAVRGGRVLAQVPLPVAGLLSDDPVDALAGRLDELNRAAASMGCKVEDPFMTLSFLALPVIPALKLTDMGLVDVSRFALVPLFPEVAGRG
jgi:adenine deaminase